MKKKITCCYCDMALDMGQITRDHIPPKSFFTVKEQSQFQAITVPSCKDCNNNSSIKDEHAKYVLNFNVLQMNNETPDQIKNLKKTVNKNQRLRSPLMNSKDILLRDSITGIHTFGKIISIDETYITDTEAVLERVARGLYWYHYKKFLNAGSCSVTFVFGMDLFASANRSHIENQQRLNFMLELKELCTKVELLPNVFTYWYGKVCDHENTACFLMSYRASVAVAVFCCPKQTDFSYLPTAAN